MCYCTLLISLCIFLCTVSVYVCVLLYPISVCVCYRTLCVCVCCVHCPVEQQNVRKGLPFFKGLRVTLLYKPYTYLTTLYMLCWLAVQVCVRDGGCEIVCAFHVHMTHICSHMQHTCTHMHMDTHTHTHTRTHTRTHTSPWFHSVRPGQPCAVRQVCDWPWGPLPVHHHRAAPLQHPVNALLAVPHC